MSKTRQRELRADRYDSTQANASRCFTRFIADNGEQTLEYLETEHCHLAMAVPVQLKKCFRCHATRIISPA